MNHIAQLHGFLLLASTSAVTVAQGLPVNPFNWVGLAVLGSLLVMAAAAIIYMLAPILGSRGMRQWAIFQIYEAAISVVLVFVFLGILALFFINPQASLQKANLVPQGCTDANTIYTLSSCNLAQFNSATFDVVYDIYIFSVIQGLSPSLLVQINLYPSPPPNVQMTFELPNVFTALSGSSFKVGAGITNVFSSINSGLFMVLNQIYDSFLVLSQLQLIVVSASELFFAFFMTLGLIARVFGFSRSFGGTMIALGIGMGLVYPMMVALTYGFVDVQAHTACAASIVCSSAVTASVTAGTIGVGFLTSMVFAFPVIGAGALGIAALGTAAFPTQIAQLAGSALSSMFNVIGYLLAGLTIVPVINILVVDIFVMDFSQAFGERISFQQMFSQFI